MLPLSDDQQLGCHQSETYYRGLDIQSCLSQVGCLTIPQNKLHHESLSPVLQCCRSAMISSLFATKVKVSFEDLTYSLAVTCRLLTLSLTKLHHESCSPVLQCCRLAMISGLFATKVKVSFKT